MLITGVNTIVVFSGNIQHPRVLLDLDEFSGNNYLHNKNSKLTDHINMHDDLVLRQEKY